MPGFESIIDQERPIRILTTYLREGNIPHALLFTGISGIGKRTTARLFSMACNCKRFAPDGSRLEWATFLGGTGGDGVRDLAVDSDGNAYVAGGSNHLIRKIT